MRKYLLECCVDSVESAINAQKGGAQRLELCANLIIGGTTPSLALFEAVKKYTGIPVRVLIRPRFGDFLYSPYEFDVLLQEVEMFKEAHADGIVVGALTPDGNLDMEQMTKLMNLAKEMPVTLHRAFDMCQDPFAALENAVALGIDTILTSGQKNHCLAGKELLGKLCEAADERLQILVGGGVTAEVISELLSDTKLNAFHMSGKIMQDSKMTYRKNDVSMGISTFSEYQIQMTDTDKIKAAASVIEKAEKEY